MEWRERLLRILGPGMLGGVTLGVWKRLLGENGYAVAPGRLPRAMAITHQAVLNSLLQWREKSLDPPGTPVDVSYLADTALLFRYFEHAGQLRQAVSVIKKRSGPHERTIREMWLEPGRIVIGAPLTEFQGFISPAPQRVAPMRAAPARKRKNRDGRA